MREIKFRVWQKHHKSYFTLQEMANQGCIMPYDNELKDITNDLLIIEQYTGLKDKNGVEIYEGDIVKQLDISTFPKTYKTTTIKFDATRGYDIWPHDIEVIGNIHEGVKK